MGVLEAYGPEALIEGDTISVLSSLTGQAASALENARLYRELAERERRLRDLVGKLLGAQEEERRRVAYEVHDGLAQMVSVAHQYLETFARRHAPTSQRSREELNEALMLIQQAVKEARRIIASLRPTELDDLGLAAAIRLQIDRLRDDGWQLDYAEDLGEERLPASVETVLFRIIQEALTNVRKHAQSERVRLEIRRQKNSVDLKIQDWGRGFDPRALSSESGPGERVGVC